MMKRKITGAILAGLSVLTLAGCRSKIPVDPDSGQTGSKTELRINFATGNALKTLTYNTGSPITLPDGSIYTNGQLKPVWSYISNQLNISIKDVTVQGQTASNMIQIAAATNFEDAEIYGGNVAETFMQYGARDKLINLLDYQDKLPDFMDYLEEYPLIKQQITAYDGGIYHIPYVAEMDEFSKVFYGRYNWVEVLLDTDDVLPETKTLDIAYEGYWKDDNQRNTTNVIILQNQKALNGTLSGRDAREALLQYIDSTYPNLENRSDLYLGETSNYDIDELIALWRVIKLYPNTLFELTTGKSGTCEIIPYFFRTKSQREEIFKLINYFGGTRVYGTNTYTGKWFVDESNTLQYTFYQDELYEGIDYLKDIFSEGLINPDYDDTNNSADYRSLFYSSDLSTNSSGASTVKQLGFMTFDFIPSTAASSPTGVVKAMLPPVTTLEGMHDDNFYHYIEIPRTVMIDGCQDEPLDLHGEDEFLNVFTKNKVSNVAKTAIGLGNPGSTHDATGPGNVIYGNVVENSNGGIQVSYGTPDTQIYNNEFNNLKEGSTAINISYGPATTIRNNKINTISGTSVGISVYYSYVWNDPSLGLYTVDIQSNTIQKVNTAMYFEAYRTGTKIKNNVFTDCANGIVSDLSSFELPPVSNYFDEVKGTAVYPVQEGNINRGNYESTINPVGYYYFKGSHEEPLLNRVIYEEYTIDRSLLDATEKVYLRITTTSKSAKQHFFFWAAQNLEWDSSELTWGNAPYINNPTNNPDLPWDSTGEYPISIYPYGSQLYDPNQECILITELECVAVNESFLTYYVDITDFMKNKLTSDNFTIIMTNETMDAAYSSVRNMNGNAESVWPCLIFAD